MGCPRFIQWNPELSRRHIDSPVGKHTQRSFTACQRLNDLVDRPISARCDDQVDFQFDRFACKLLSFSCRMRVPEVSLPSMSTQKSERFMQMMGVMWQSP